ncbi:MAG: hypothetical protein PHO37_10760 [Kiritimatiellae bacterium]|nr:hypothetical protein [Kiritimatiellia bacterium]
MKILTTIIGVCFLSSLNAQGKRVRICFEAEGAQSIEAPVCIVSNNIGEVSGGAISIPEGAGNPPKRCEGAAEYSFELEKKGVYTLWCRVWWEDECGNSFTVKINDDPAILFGEDATYKVWHWVKYPVARTSAKINLKAGKNTMRIENREDGIMVDQILFSEDQRFVPVDIEKTGTFK